ncbi:HET-domain-containing protein [Cubamyces sp. BRFM 1775]|nr:HET-domain-containing protein [Cubamyces sp. BRFM 1775]
MLPPRPPSICRACWKGPFAVQLGIFESPIVEAKSVDHLNSPATGGYMYRVSPTALLLRAAFGCLWSRFLVQRCQKHSWEIQWLTRFKLGIRIGRGSREMDLKVLIDDVCVVYDLNIYTTLDDPAQAWISQRPRLTDVGSSRTLYLAKACINVCMHAHERCLGISPRPSDALPPPQPTRLVDCSKPTYPRIVLSNGTRRIYAALSYVWGESQPHRTTKSNLSSYITGIDPVTLPQTIRDAIHVTHQLGIYFLWVDSLCIIQDSQVDKYRELASMRDIYRYAYLTIDAASAKRASDGFLQDRPPLNPVVVLPFICPLSFANPPSAVGTLYVAYKNAQIKDVGTSNVVATMTGQRAWCLQEMLMSTRSLVFTSHTVQLRCQTATQNIGWTPHNYAYDVDRLPDAVFRPVSPVKHGSEEWREIRRVWHSIVDDYSGRSLSYSADKLVACAGIADMFAQVLGSNHLVGLWHDDFLVHDLLWEVHSDQPGPPRPKRYRAPSWSWASVDAEVKCHAHTAPFEVLLKVVRSTITLEDDAFPFGPVIDGSLILRACLFECKLVDSDPFSKPYLSISGSSRSVYKPNLHTVRISPSFDSIDDSDI